MSRNAMLSRRAAIVQGRRDAPTAGHVGGVRRGFFGYIPGDFPPFYRCHRPPAAFAPRHPLCAGMGRKASARGIYPVRAAVRTGFFLCSESCPCRHDIFLPVGRRYDGLRQIRNAS